MIPAWTDDWVGIPYEERGRGREGCDCLGLYILLHRERFSTEIPDPYCTVAGAVRRDVVAQNRALYDAVTEPREGDAILIRAKGQPLHVGYLLDARNMLHSERDVGSVVERWNGSKWKNRVIGIYRYAGRLS